MPNPDLVAFIRAAQKQGVPKEEIIQTLLANGWTGELINEAFVFVGQIQGTYTTAAVSREHTRSMLARILLHGGILFVVVIAGIGVFVYRPQIMALLPFQIETFFPFHIEYPLGTVDTLSATTTAADTGSNTGSASAAPQGAPSSGAASTTNKIGAVTGYVWTAHDGPKFASLSIPAWQVNDKNFQTYVYTVSIFNGKDFVEYKKVKALEEITFPQGGVSAFKITGLNPAWEICSSDRTVTWAISFAKTGQARATREPVTTGVPNATCAAIDAAAAEAAQREAALASQPLPSGFLVPTAETFPSEFQPASRYPRTVFNSPLKKGYTLKYDSSGRLSSITVENIMNIPIPATNELPTYASDKNKIKDFTHQNHPGVILQEHNDTYKLTLTRLYWGDGSRLVSIQLSEFDSRTTPYTPDDLVLWLETFVRQP